MDMADADRRALRAMGNDSWSADQLMANLESQLAAWEEEQEKHAPHWDDEAEHDVRYYPTS